MATGAHVEIESKFDVTADTAAPELTLGGELTADQPRVMRMSATYYDTADLRLTRAKITLRRRTGGKDAGWHVKLPAVSSGGESAARVEIGFPLGEGTEVPDAVRQVVLGRVRDLELSPIARVDNERHETVLRRDGRPVVEFCDDHVDTESFVSSDGGGAWREWELEWVGPGTDGEYDNSADAALMERLAAACRDAGAAAPSGPSKLARAVGPLPEQPVPGHGHVYEVLAEDIEQLLSHDPGARRATMVGIHQARVATRNLRSTLGTYGDELAAACAATDDPVDLDWLAGELKELAAVMGKVRDVQVVRDRLHELADLYSVDIVSAQVRRRIDTELDIEERRAGDRVGRAMVDPRYVAVLAALEQVRDVAGGLDTAAGPGPARSPQAARATADVTPAAAMSGVKRQYKRFSKVRSRTEQDLASLELTLAQREELTHVVRKRAKALRRSVQSIDRKAVPAVAPLRTACGRLHTVLGDVQDSVTTRQWLRRIARRAEAAGESTFGFGVMFEHERGFSENTLAGFESEAATITAAFRELQAAEKSARKKRKRGKGKKPKK